MTLKKFFNYLILNLTNPNFINFVCVSTLILFNFFLFKKKIVKTIYYYLFKKKEIKTLYYYWFINKPIINNNKINYFYTDKFLSYFESGWFTISNNIIFIRTFVFPFMFQLMFGGTLVSFFIRYFFNTLLMLLLKIPNLN